MIQSGVYAYRGLKPGARFHIPIISYQWLYVGETKRRTLRDQQHRYGDRRYQVDPKPWSDREPRQALWIPLPPWRWLLRSVETLVILALWPVYNVQKNRWNPRRIHPITAIRHRAERDVGGRPLWVGPFWYVAILGLGVYAWIKLGGMA